MAHMWRLPVKVAVASFVFTVGFGMMIQCAAAQTPLGMALYQAKCGGCHSLDTNRIGPAHRGVVGRKPGSAVGYAYSSAIKKLAGSWTPTRLDTWLKAPQRMVPGSKMFLSIGDAATRASIIAYLQSVSAPVAVKRK
jgi:cytochrome c